MLDITTRARGKNSVNKLAMRRINCNVSETRLSRSEKFHRRLGPTNGSPLYRVNFNINNIFLHLLLFIRSVHREAYCSCFPHTIYSVTLAEKVFRRFGVQLNQQFHSLYYYPFISFPTILLVSINEITFTRLPLSLSAWYFVHHINKPLAPCAFSVHIHTHTLHTCSLAEPCWSSWIFRFCCLILCRVFAIDGTPFHPFQLLLLLLILLFAVAASYCCLLLWKITTKMSFKRWHILTQNKMLLAGDNFDDCKLNTNYFAITFASDNWNDIEHNISEQRERW